MSLLFLFLLRMDCGVRSMILCCRIEPMFNDFLLDTLTASAACYFGFICYDKLLKMLAQFLGPKPLTEPMLNVLKSA